LRGVLVGFADFVDGYYTAVDHQKVQDSNPSTMHYYTTIDQKKSQIQTQDHALHRH
jgi:predicted transcriptional regulator of viral defense system